MNTLTSETYAKAIQAPGWKLVQFMSQGCPNCQMNARWLDTMGEVSFHQPVTVYGIIPDEALIKQFNITHAPTCTLFDPKGKAVVTTQLLGEQLAAAVNLILDTEVPVV